VQRIFVHKDVYKQFEMKFLEACSEVKVGNPLESDTIVGPMISLAEAERVEQWCERSRCPAEQNIAWGGKRKGSMFEPTVLDSVTPAMKVCRRRRFSVPL